MGFETGIGAQVKDPKQKKLLMVAGAVFAVAFGIVGWLYFGPSSAPAASPSGTPSTIPAQTTGSGAGAGSSAPRGIQEADIKHIKLDVSVLEDTGFQDLKVYSREIPLQRAEIHGQNPFAFVRPSPTPTLTPTPTPSARELRS